MYLLNKYTKILIIGSSPAKLISRIFYLLLIPLQIVISFIFPLMLYQIFLAYAVKENLVLGVGCEGPGVFFGILSGILFALFLRSNYH